MYFVPIFMVNAIFKYLILLSHIVCHGFQVYKLHNEVGAPSVFKMWSWHLEQTNKKGLTLKAMWWKKRLFKAYLFTLSQNNYMVYLFT
jgi:hypothetical protein